MASISLVGSMGYISPLDICSMQILEVTEQQPEDLAHKGLLPTSTFSTTCFPKEHTLVEQVMTMFSGLSYWLETP